MRGGVRPTCLRDDAEPPAIAKVTRESRAADAIPMETRGHARTPGGPAGAHRVTAFGAER